MSWEQLYQFAKGNSHIVTLTSLKESQIFNSVDISKPPATVMVIYTKGMNMKILASDMEPKEESSGSAFGSKILV